MGFDWEFQGDIDQDISGMRVVDVNIVLDRAVESQV